MSYKHLNLRLLTIISLFFTLNTKAQDTTVIQTLQWEDNFRAAYYDFPDDPSKSYRKILMYYNMRCPDAAVNPGNNSQGCGEWDYSCNTFITDTTQIDSSKATHPNYLISNFSGTNYAYTDLPTFEFIRHEQYSTELISAQNETEVNLGTDTDELVLPAYTKVNRIQLIYKADELLNAGLQAGAIERLKLHINQGPDSLHLFKIRLKNTVLNALNAIPEEDGFTEVYHQNLFDLSAGEQLFNFYQAFQWDETNNILVDISYVSLDPNQQVLTLKADDEQENLSIAHHSNDQAAYFNRNGFYELNTENIQGNYETLSISFWANGDEAIQPANNSLTECTTDNGRQMNIHLPWSNGQVYWDCGNDGNGYDRINKPADASDYKGNWTHWTFTKNAGTGSMKIYLNGEEWHSGNQKNKSIEINEVFRIGSSTGSNSYFGRIDNLSFWNKELLASDIEELMYQKVDQNYTDYASLLAFFDFEDLNSNTLQAISPYNVEAYRSGRPFPVSMRSADIFKEFTALNKRPVLSFYQGQYEWSNDLSYYQEAIPVEANRAVSFYVDNNDLLVQDTSYLYQAGYQYIKDTEGNIVDSLLYDATGNIEITDLNYYNKTNAKFEILSLVTPYGFFLDLGQEGKTFIFDLTDYAPILKGSKRMSIEMGGQNQEDLDIKFLFIEGTPEREVMNIQNIWPFRRAYPGGLSDDSYFEPRNIQLDPSASHFRIRSTITGHGQNGEFIPQEHFINVNGGAKEFNYEVWKYCGQNPIFPQGGTWIFDRAGWCPGAPSDIHMFDLNDFVSPGDNISLDYGLNTSSNSNENYLVSNQLVTYGAYNFQLDASIERILSPNTNVETERINPTCNDAQIEIKNTGANTLNSIVIEYFVDGTGITKQEEFNLDLQSGEFQTLNLPVESVAFFANGSDETGIFHAKIISVNGQTDNYQDNDQLASPFNQVKTFDPNFDLLIRLVTNNRASENSYRILDNQGNIVLSKDNLDNLTQYKDELILPNGCYTFVFEDSGNDGLDFWYWDAIGEDVGTGALSISRKITETVNLPLKVFNPDFGGSFTYDFIIGDITSTQNIEEAGLFSVYPNPSGDWLNIELQGLEGEDLQVQLLDINGRAVRSIELNQKPKDWTLQWNIEEEKPGIYLLRVVSKNKQLRQTVIIH